MHIHAGPGRACTAMHSHASPGKAWQAGQARDGMRAPCNTCSHAPMHLCTTAVQMRLSPERAWLGHCGNTFGMFGRGGCIFKAAAYALPCLPHAPRGIDPICAGSTAHQSPLPCTWDTHTGFRMLPPAACMPQRPEGPCTCVCQTFTQSHVDISGILKRCMEILKATHPAPLASCCMLTSSPANLKAAAPSRSGALGVLL